MAVASTRAPARFRYRPETPHRHRGNALKRRNAQIFRLPPPAPHDSIRGVANQKECRAVRPPMPSGGAEQAAPSMNPAYLQHYEPTGEFRL
ncbi:hypothetical protein [Burkholderia sp. NLJ2]|uniref:hypothetical protein n=1 Tax=Burkholderia sp. NLJ2 TaxID=3090699 RepID=UPI003C6CBCFD